MALLLEPHYSLGAFSCLFSVGSVPGWAKVATPPVTIFLVLLHAWRKAAPLLWWARDGLLSFEDEAKEPLGYFQDKR